ncbi:hypothetical protein EVAR_81554_1 [Eumeta japonica]|uniref:Uncharacterized protein n=1 Tax=Eumeta variegata TaxID=151549 RepID=A0A4C1UZ88_EUMVA|nr:hypothetical protein EVAR_81554_1 [Eumeta japonica]
MRAQRGGRERESSNRLIRELQSVATPTAVQAHSDRSTHIHSGRIDLGGLQNSLRVCNHPANLPRATRVAYTKNHPSLVRVCVFQQMQSSEKTPNVEKKLAATTKSPLLSVRRHRASSSRLAKSGRYKTHAFPGEHSCIRGLILTSLCEQRMSPTFDRRCGDSSDEAADCCGKIVCTIIRNKAFHVGRGEIPSCALKEDNLLQLEIPLKTSRSLSRPRLAGQVHNFKVP